MFRRLLKSSQPVSPPSSTNILDEYVKTAPSKQTALDLFKGEWSSALPKSAHLKTDPGKAGLFEDPRIIWANERLSFADKTILELGPLEAGHSYMAQAFGASRVFAIEANTRAFMKCLIIKEIFNLDRVHFGLGDFNAYIEESGEKFDICLASGVLYHCVDLPKTLQLLSNCVDDLFIWTHYYDHKIISEAAHLRKYFRAPEKAEAFGRSFEIARKDYKEALKWKGFCGGLEEYAYWWPKDAFFHILQSLGFKSIEVGFDHPDHPNGPAFAICASRQKPTGTN